MTTVVSVTRSSTSLVTILFAILLVIVGLISGGLYFYKIYLTNQRTALSQNLVKASDTFEQGTISELELFDKRTTAAKQILTSHIILSPLFSLIGQLTVPAVQFTKFEHTTDDKGFSVSLSGVAHDYKSIALQADAFNSTQGRSFKNVVFSNLTKDTTGNVTFDVEFIVDPTLLSYSKNPNALSGDAIPASVTLPQPTTTTTTTTTTPTDPTAVTLPQPTTSPTSPKQ